MSIEALIKAHTEALLENTAAVKNLTLSLAGRSVTAASKAADAVETPRVKTAKEDAAIKEKLEAEVKEEPKTEVNVEEGIDVTVATPYETVRELVLETAKAGKRDALATLFKKHGIANLKVLLDKEDDFTTVNDQVKLEAVYADLQALEA